LVERNLAKVEVASSSLVSRSNPFSGSASILCNAVLPDRASVGFGVVPVPLLASAAVPAPSTAFVGVL
jgi:hypothetical protein